MKGRYVLSIFDCIFWNNEPRLEVNNQNINNEICPPSRYWMYIFLFSSYFLHSSYKSKIIFFKISVIGKKMKIFKTMKFPIVSFGLANAMYNDTSNLV